MFVYSLSGLQLDESGGGAPVEIEDNETTARTAVYQTFGRVFLGVDDQGWELASSGTWAKEIGDAGRLLAFAYDPGDSPAVDDRGALERQLGGLTLQARDYFDDPDRMHDEVVRFYEYFGLGASEDARPVDHLVTECDFLQYVTFKEAAATSDRLRASYRRAQLDFLDRHFSVWVPRLAEKLAADGSPFFAWASAALARFVEADRAYVAQLLGA
ncbi:MAG: molecular chaperone TorD family protein [Acidimicrobiia bacterium]|nr:molecular chaperone TorD family protein [Acidimicrobiia bacterium]